MKHLECSDCARESGVEECKGVDPPNYSHPPQFPLGDVHSSTTKEKDGLDSSRNLRSPPLEITTDASCGTTRIVVVTPQNFFPTKMH